MMAGGGWASRLWPLGISWDVMVVAAVQTLSVFCCIGVAFALLPSLYGGVLFAWHPLFMVVGYLGFMTEGIVAAYRFRNLDGGPRVQAIQNHGWIQGAATVSVALGFLAIWSNKAAKGKPHFTSLHGKLGLIAMVLTALSPLLGVGSFKRLGIITKFPEPWQPRIKWIHRLLAVCTWVLALVTMQLDLPHPAVFEGLWCRLWQAGVVALGVTVLMLLRSRGAHKAMLPTNNSFSRPRQPSVGSFGSFGALPKMH